MSVTFRFRQIASKLFGTIYRPIAVVEFKHKTNNYWLPIQMIVDTGADYTILPRSFALPLGVNLKLDCQVHETVGIGGSVRVFLYENQRVRLGKQTRIIPIGFIDRDSGPALLGRHKFLETFKVVFANHQTQFIVPHVRSRGAH